MSPFGADGHSPFNGVRATATKSSAPSGHRSQRTRDGHRRPGGLERRASSRRRGMLFADMGEVHWSSPGTDQQHDRCCHRGSPRLTSAVHAEGAKVFQQLMHGGPTNIPTMEQRRGARHRFADPGLAMVCRPMTKRMIAEVIDGFAGVRPAGAWPEASTAWRSTVGTATCSVRSVTGDQPSYRRVRGFARDRARLLFEALAGYATPSDPAGRRGATVRRRPRRSNHGIDSARRPPRTGPDRLWSTCPTAVTTGATC